ncbi:MAG: hypothetical protein AB7I37_20385 [Pirellulales bacterium]
MTSSLQLSPLAIAACVLLPATLAAAELQTPQEIGSRRELFVDRWLIESLTGARLHMHEPRDEGPVLKFDQPWEGPQSGYTTILHDGDRYLAYYRGISEPGLDGSDHERACLAESVDGREWTKPQLGLFEFAGNSSNNIVLANAAPATHNFCPMLDTRPGMPPAERYKAVGGTGDKLFAFVSADGRHWKRWKDGPILSTRDVPFKHIHLFDSQNLAFWSDSEQVYVCYFRVWDGLRKIARSTSPDFTNWSPAVLMEQIHNDGIHGPRPAPPEHLYTSQTSPYFRASHLYISTAARFFEGRQVLNEQQARAIGVNPDYFHDTSDSVLMSSRGGHVFDRTFLEGYIKPGIGPRNWVSRTNYPALNVVPTGPAEMSLYVNHDYAQPTSHLRRYSLRLDGFASIRAGAAGGEFLSRPLVFRGSALQINFATSAGGGIRWELQEPDGTPISGFTLSECQEQIGNEIARTVAWQAGSDVSTLAGRPLRVRAVLKDADLFAMQFVEEE